MVAKAVGCRDSISATEANGPFQHALEEEENEFQRNRLALTCMALVVIVAAIDFVVLSTVAERSQDWRTSVAARRANPTAGVGGVGQPVTSARDLAVEPRPDGPGQWKMQQRRDRP